jgi:molybdenum cofactor cytidylyltransferase
MFALIPAGGKSVRMGRPKLTLPLGARSVLECVVVALRAAGIEQVVVVVGPHVPELVPLAEAAGAQVCLLAQETADMRATVEEGLRWLEHHFHPQPTDGWLLVPADHPLLDPTVVRSLTAAWQASPGHSVIVPTHQGRRGHPVLIAWHHVAGIRAWPAGLGLNRYLRQQSAETLEVPVASEAVLWDLDTPADYERLQAVWRERQS